MLKGLRLLDGRLKKLGLGQPRFRADLKAAEHVASFEYRGCLGNSIVCQIYFLSKYHSFQNYYIAIDAFRTF